MLSRSFKRALSKLCHRYELLRHKVLKAARRNIVFQKLQIYLSRFHFRTFRTFAGQTVSRASVYSNKNKSFIFD